MVARLHHFGRLAPLRPPRCTCCRGEAAAGDGCRAPLQGAPPLGRSGVLPRPPHSWRGGRGGHEACGTAREVLGSAWTRHASVNVHGDSLDAAAAAATAATAAAAAGIVGRRGRGLSLGWSIAVRGGWAREGSCNGSSVSPGFRQQQVGLGQPEGFDGRWQEGHRDGELAWGRFWRSGRGMERTGVEWGRARGRAARCKGAGKALRSAVQPMGSVQV